MSEQQAPPVDTPEPVDTPDPGTDTQDPTDWESRYKEAQAWGTQNAQRAADLERYEQAVEALRSDDPQAREWAAQTLGIELLAEEEDPDEFVAPDEELRREIAEIKAWREQLTQQEEQQALEVRDIDVIGTGLRQLAQKLGRDLTQKEIGLLGDSAWSNRDEQGLPDIAAVTAAHEDILQAHAPAKPRPKAPHFSSVSQAGTQTTGPLTHAQRVENAMEKLQSEQ